MVERALERAELLRLLDMAALNDVLARATGRLGAGVLRAALAHYAPEQAPARSELERRFLSLVRRAGLPRPVVNTLVAGYEVDFHWPAQRLVVETDGAATHLTRRAFERDRRRDAALQLAGQRVVRFTWRHVTGEPEAVEATLRALLTGL
jgi:very-short-patch-repair endonuclease